MHGVIFNQLAQFVKGSYGQDSLTSILGRADLNAKTYMLTTSYPDEELEAIITGACHELSMERDVVLDAFGQFIAPNLMKIYGSYVKNEWTAFDLLENIESTIHETVRSNNPGAEPPMLDIKRVSNEELTITYRSKRKMLTFGEGIIKAIGKHYNEQLVMKKSLHTDFELLTVTCQNVN